MDIQVTKADIIKRFKEINDESLIMAIKSLLDYAQGHKSIPKEDNIGRYTDAEMVAGAERSERDIKEGKTISGAQFKVDVESWKKKKQLNIK